MCLAIPGCIEAIVGAQDELSRSARVRFGQITKEINVSLVPEADVGDFVLVHVGVAIQKIDTEEARRVFELLEAMDELGREGGA